MMDVYAMKKRITFIWIAIFLSVAVTVAYLLGQLARGL